jgi:uncharacterized membrane protein YhaH (DUF805 family)
MAVDLFDMLVQILQISPTLANEYAAQGPIYQLFYLFFFPMVFIVLLIYIIMRRFSDNRGLSILVGVAVLAFIILQGWYTFFAYLSRFWILILVILGFIWTFFYHKEKKAGEGGKGRTVSTFDRLGQQLMGRAYRDLTGVTKEIEGKVERAIEAVKGSSDTVEFSENRTSAEVMLEEYRRSIELAGTTKGLKNRYPEFEKKLAEAITHAKKKGHVKKMA